MEEQNTPSVKHLIDNVVNTFIKLISEIARLASLEAQLAKKSLVRIIALVFVVGSLLTVTWLCALGCLLLYLVSLHLSWLLSLGIITLLNVVLLTSIFVAILFLKENLLFKATRRQLSNQHKTLTDVQSEVRN